jgi:hypothetical protein
MARILFTTHAMAGHIRPGLAAARELVAAGHHVAWYTGTKYRRLVTATGASFVPYPAELDWDDADLATTGRGGKPGLRALEQALIDIFIAPLPAHAAALSRVVERARGLGRGGGLPAHGPPRSEPAPHRRPTCAGRSVLPGRCPPAAAGLRPLRRTCPGRRGDPRRRGRRPYVTDAVAGVRT